MIYAIIILLVSVAALAIWVWEIHNRLSNLDESSDTALSQYFKLAPSWKYNMERALHRLDTLENAVFPPPQAEYYKRSVQNYTDDDPMIFQPHCWPVRVFKEAILKEKTWAEQKKRLIRSLKKSRENGYNY